MPILDVTPPSATFDPNSSLVVAPSPPSTPTVEALPPKASTSPPLPPDLPSTPPPTEEFPFEPPLSLGGSNNPPSNQPPPATPPIIPSQSPPPPPPPPSVRGPPPPSTRGPSSSSPPPLPSQLPLLSPPKGGTPPPPPSPPTSQLPKTPLIGLPPPPPPTSQLPKTPPIGLSPPPPHLALPNRPFVPPPPTIFFEESPSLVPPPPTIHATPPTSLDPPTPIEDSTSTFGPPPPPPTRNSPDLVSSSFTSSSTSNGRSPHLASLPSSPKDSTSSSTTPSSSSSSTSEGAFAVVVVGITVAGLLVALVAILVAVSWKKKQRSDGLALHYNQSHNYSTRSDGYYYRQANPPGDLSQYSGQYASSVPSYPSTTGTFGSHGNRVLYSRPPELAGLVNSKSHFTYNEIAEMTQGFSPQNLLGEGGFGCVYKGWLMDGRVVAVKQLKAGSGQGEREFRAEVEIISRIHHRHLVSLVGYCISDHHRSLVYEFIPNKTLEHHLHGRGLPVMEWPKRLKIAIGAARGLAYLHEDCHPRIIHRDIKTANILLDNSFEAKVADFGLAKLSNDTHTHISTRVVGTFGYMAPEYASSGKLTDRSDVFSFGVVLLELITGCKPIDPSQPLGEESLVEWARPHLINALESGSFEGLVDPRLDNNYAKSEMFRMVEAAAACVRHSAIKRPRMVQVLRALDSDGELADLSNGVKYGQSTVFDSSQYSADIQQFRKVPFDTDSYITDRNYTEEYASSTAHSSAYSSGEVMYKPLNSGRNYSGEYQSSHKFPAGPMDRQGNERSFSRSHHQYHAHELLG